MWNLSLLLRDTYAHHLQTCTGKQKWNSHRTSPTCQISILCIITFISYDSLLLFWQALCMASNNVYAKVQMSQSSVFRFETWDIMWLCLLPVTVMTSGLLYIGDFTLQMWTQLWRHSLESHLRLKITIQVQTRTQFKQFWRWVGLFEFCVMMVLCFDLLTEKGYKGTTMQIWNSLTFIKRYMYYFKVALFCVARNCGFQVGKVFSSPACQCEIITLVSSNTVLIKCIGWSGFISARLMLKYYKQGKSNNCCCEFIITSGEKSFLP